MEKGNIKKQMRTPATETMPMLLVYFSWLHMLSETLNILRIFGHWNVRFLLYCCCREGADEYPGTLFFRPFILFISQPSGNRDMNVPSPKASIWYWSPHCSPVKTIRLQNEVNVRKCPASAGCVCVPKLQHETKLPSKGDEGQQQCRSLSNEWWANRTEVFQGEETQPSITRKDLRHDQAYAAEIGSLREWPQGPSTIIPPTSALNCYPKTSD